MISSPDSRADTWTTAELDHDDEQHVRESLARLPHLGHAALELAQDLEPGSSRTAYALPANVYLRDQESAMVFAARNVSEVVQQDGIERLDERFMPFALRENEQPEELGEISLPANAKASIDSEAPIGYVRVEMLEGQELRTVVGSLDPTTRTNYSVTL